MDSAYKLFLLFLVIFFLIANAKADKPGNGGLSLNGDSLSGGPHYSLVLPAKKEMYR